MQTAGLVAAASLLSLSAGQQVSDVANDMQAAIAGGKSCAPLGVIFARGTFDSGNIGVWVGPQLLAAVQERMEADIQGVDPSAYPADLDGYLSQTGGSDAGAASMAETVRRYASACPGSKIVLSGWSQGAIVAHKALVQLDDDVLSSVLGLVTFGDMNDIWGQIAVPVPSNHFDKVCLTEQPADVLCDESAPIVQLPTAQSIIDDLQHLPSVAVGAQQAEAAASLLAHFPGQLVQAWDGFTHNLTPDQFRRLMLTPQHFKYGNNGMAADAGHWVADLFAAQSATLV